MLAKQLFKGGVHPPENKITATNPITDVKDISIVRIPMNMHIGAPCKPCVKASDIVKVGQVIGEPSGIAVPIHATVSGVVKSVKKEMMGTGSLVEIIEIQNDFNDTKDESVKAPVINSKDDFIKAVLDSGMVGLGGAGFPTHMKMKPPVDKYPDVLLINAMECEPYITSDDRQMIEQSKKIIEGINMIITNMDIPKAIIGIENNKPESIQKMKLAIKELNVESKISLSEVPVRYPQGAEKTMIQVVTGRVIPAGGLPHDVKVMVLNVSTVNAIHTYLTEGMPLTSKVLTLSGDGVKTPGNYRVPIGTRISELVEKTGGFTSTPQKILMGGPMMGIAVTDLETPIVKNNNAILVFNNGSLPEESNCIRCGRCMDACPMGLMPLKLDFASRNKDFERMDEYAIMNCVECGSCSYVCPAKRQLVQNIRVGKGFYRDGLAALKAEREEKKAKEVNN